jgi:hypothetical protein
MADKNVVVKPASKDTQSKMDAVRTREGLDRQENARIRNAATRLQEKTGTLPKGVATRTVAGIAGKGGVNVGGIYKPMGLGGGMNWQTK